MSKKGKGNDLIRDLFRYSDEEFKRYYPGENRLNVFQYIRLTYLIPELLTHVDTGKLEVAAGAILSYLSEKNQQALERYCFADHRLKITQELAFMLLKADQEGISFDTKMREGYFQTE